MNLRVFVGIAVLALCVVAGEKSLYAERYVQCDACGLCRHTVMSKNCLDNPAGTISGDPTHPGCNGSVGPPAVPGDVVYVQPDSWKACFACLYPNRSGQPPISCDPADAIPSSRPVAFYKAVGGGFTPIVDFQVFRCDTLVINATTQRPQHEPAVGRVFSDLGCIETSDNFTSPNASTDVVQNLLNIVRTVTGGVGLILIMRAALRLATSRGDADKIYEAKKSLTNVVIGVVFVLFAVFIFSFFAAQVLRIPGYSINN